MSLQFELSTGPVEDLKKTLQDVDVLWFRLGYKIDETVIDSSTKCKIIACPVTGIDHIDENLCSSLGIQIICLRGEKEFLKTVRATAEHTLLLTMMLMRRSYFAFKDVLNDNWNRDNFRGYELFNKKVGILGLGRLGNITASYFHSMGCFINFYDIDDKITSAIYNRKESMEELISNSDIISIHLPYNTSTHHLYDKKFFSYFNNNKWLVNTSRGGIIKEEELLIALKENRIAGAALDVLSGEPKNINKEILQYAKSNENLIITPHIGGNTMESFEKTERFVAKKILQSLSYG